MARPRVHHFDERFFGIIDRGEKAYWFGFLVGDGSLGWARGRFRSVQIRLSSTDRSHLRKFCKAIGGDDRLIHTGENQVRTMKSGVVMRASEYVRVHLWSLGMVQTLLNLGFREKKFAYKVPSLPKEFEGDYWRGVFDADGCVSWIRPNNGKSHLCFKLSGPEGICRGFSNFLGYAGRYVYPIKGCNCHHFVLTVRRREKGLLLFHKLYGSIINGTNRLDYLERKLDKFTGYLVSPSS